MKYIGLLSSAASGKMGGIVASHNRNGSYFRRHAIPTQKRTAKQSLFRAQLAALSSAFKTLTAAQVQAWNSAAAVIVLKSKLGTTYNPTGQQWFVSCNKHLQSIGITAILANPVSAPTFPSITTMTVTPTVVGGMVTEFPITTTPTPNAAFALLVRGTGAVSNGRTFFSKSAFRTLTYSNPAAAPTSGNLAALVAIFGGIPVTGQVMFELRYIDPISGCASSPVRAIASFSQLGFTITPVTATLYASHSAASVVVNFNTAQVGNYPNTIAWTVALSGSGVGASTVAVSPASGAAPSALVATVTLTTAVVGNVVVTVTGTVGSLVVHGVATIVLS